MVEDLENHKQIASKEGAQCLAEEIDRNVADWKESASACDIKVGMVLAWCAAEMVIEDVNSLEARCDGEGETPVTMVASNSGHRVLQFVVIQEAETPV